MVFERLFSLCPGCGHKETPLQAHAIYITGTAASGKSITGKALADLLPRGRLFLSEDLATGTGPGKILEMVKVAQAHASSGQMAVVDLVDTLGAYRTAMQPPSLEAHHGILLCLYCNLPETLRRLSSRQERNMNIRPPLEGIAAAISQWTSMYRLTPDRSNLTIDTMHRTDYDAILAAIPAGNPMGDFARAHIPHYFPFSPAKLNLYVEPRLQYDLVVDSSHQTPQETAVLIKRFLEGRSRHTEGAPAVLHTPSVGMTQETIIRAQRWEDNCRSMGSHNPAQMEACTVERRELLRFMEGNDSVSGASLRAWR
mmetsp:Transcript_112395/g.195213  ORF Transcript_112395/g.195213 Transcript_112395/m.195213 type:complete len:312 (-) Transcript_112395:1156-2091(-)